MNEEAIIYLIKQALSGVEAPISSFIFACADDDGEASIVAWGNDIECVGLAFHAAQRMSSKIEVIKEEG